MFFANFCPFISYTFYVLLDHLPPSNINHQDLMNFLETIEEEQRGKYIILVTIFSLYSSTSSVKNRTFPRASYTYAN